MTIHDVLNMTVDQFAEAFEAAWRADQNRIAARVATVDAQPVPKRLAIKMFARNGSPVYVTGVRFADGDGYRIRKFAYTPDASKAHVFSADCGLAVARQIVTRTAVVLEAR